VSERLRAALRGLPRCPLALLPTPLEVAPRLGARLGVELWVKREEQSGLGLGGNKARQVEVLLGDALAHGAEVVLTTAGAQSNFCRAFAAGAARLGLRCILLLRGDGRAATDGNLLLNLLFGAEVHWIATEDPYDPAVLERLQALAATAGGRAWIVQLPGAAGPLAAAAAAGLALEIAEQGEPDAIWLAAGSGLTAAGLALGCAALGMRTRVRVVSVQQRRGFIEPLIRRRIAEAAALLGLEPPSGVRLAVDDGWIGPGYGQPSRAALDAMVLAARLEGWALDPAYTGKALAALIAGAAQGERVVFVHSGGAPALFAHGAAVAAHLREAA
jgi:1-aminocyclopropane-1-carboxylate deaminase/D-cysteine desulfhydrase-like pyridoxal-dependent ACC family enzyme